ncbi:hypothetical protein GKE82_07090 [Conexibacter sp. W3-3-2]|uniref:PQQ-dependent sugar dehydrogenase n=1 Tax=Conexibacter sp. W3-3-2 TaxID=2675227 RepID=UPI0012B922D4|nr:PQQ-dependent sugar dehydrogenase [Conexibacter sp. W3-3-2]MTD44073.1 hypothetical protein [Conexibacter sp. W3-3-2]
MRRIATLGLLLLAALAVPAAAQAGRTTVAKVPSPTNLAFDGQGRLWATSGVGAASPNDGVWLAAGPGVTAPRHVVKRLPVALGLVWLRGSLYVSYAASRRTGRVVRYFRFNGRSFDRKEVVVRSLPIGRHTLDSMAVGPDGRIYLGVGSEFDAERSRRRYSGSIVSFAPDGGGLRTEARGLRNPYGLAFIPGTDRLLVTDNGRDDLGPDRPPDELNLVDTGAPVRDYGFPDCAGQGGAACAGTVAPLLDLPTHSSAVGIAVAPDWNGGGLTAFVAQNGSTIRPRDPTGRDVLRIRLTARSDGGYDATPDRLAGPFALRDPLGVALSPAGDALFVSMYRSGRIDRYTP